MTLVITINAKNCLKLIFFNRMPYYAVANGRKTGVYDNW